MSNKQNMLKLDNYHIINRLGGKFIYLYRSFEHFCRTLGELLIGFGLFFVDRDAVVWNNWRHYFYSFGPKRIFRLCSFNFILSFIISAIAGLQLAKIGLGSYMVRLVIDTLLRTITPFVIAVSILITSGKSFTQDSLQRKLRISEIEEKNLLRFRLVPETTAIMFVLPFLYVFAIFAVLIACLLSSMWFLDMIPQEFIYQIQDKLMPIDYMAGLIKVVFYAIIIGIFKSHYYLLSYHSKREVANAVTRFILNCALWFVLIDFLIEFFIIFYGEVT